jgi:hypothetical protein
VSLLLSLDVHARFAITEALRERGVDVLTAQDDGATDFQTRSCWTER